MVPQLTPSSRRTSIAAADPSRLGWHRRFAAATTTSLLLAAFHFALAAAPKQPRLTDPIVTLPLESLGYLAAPPHTLANNLYTVHFVDSTHLLFTFNSRGLLTRLPDATPEDDDRNVTALLLELPSGKVLARTVWRTRDRDQYLWALTHGRFLLRIRNKLTVIQPLENLHKDNPFHESPFYEQPFLEFKRRIAYIAVSPGGDLLTVETAPPRHAETIDQAAIAAALAAAAQAQARANGQSQTAVQPQLHTRNGVSLPSSTSATTATPKPKPAPPPELESEQPGRPPIDLHFFRLFIDTKPGEPDRLAAQSAGVIVARSLVNLPATAEGFLDTLKESSTVYNFDFQTHTGKRTELAAYDTTCAPRPYFVSRSEFVAFGCHGADRVQISGFNLRGEEPWVSVFSGQHVFPAIATAPDAGRFALSRILISTSGIFDADNIQPDELTGQEIAVTQNHDGRTLLKLQVTPVQRASQNFDLSADGLFLTVVRNGNVEVYRLPPLTPTDQKDIQLAVSTIPAKNDVIIRINSGKSLTSTPTAAPITVPATPLEAVTAATSEPTPTAGDAPPEATRKPPTLYDPGHPKPPNP